MKTKLFDYKCPRCGKIVQRREVHEKVTGYCFEKLPYAVGEVVAKKVSLDFIGEHEGV